MGNAFELLLMGAVLQTGLRRTLVELKSILCFKRISLEDFSAICQGIGTQQPPHLFLGLQSIFTVLVMAQVLAAVQLSTDLAHWMVSEWAGLKQGLAQLCGNALAIDTNTGLDPSDDTKLRGGTDTPEGQDTIQEDLKSSISGPTGITWGLTRPSTRCWTWCGAAFSTNTDWEMNRSRAALLGRTKGMKRDLIKEYVVTG